MMCVECGKETEKLYNGLCIDCYLKKKRFFDIPSQVLIKVCRNCGAYSIDGEWKHERLENIIEEYFRKNIRHEIDCKLEIDFENRIARCTGYFEGRKIIEERKFEIRFKKRLCEKCSLKKGGYFEAILQIRKKDLSKKLEKEMEEVITKRVEEGNSFIMKKERVEEGLNYYIGSKKVAHSIARELKNFYKAEYKSSSSLVGMKDGVEVYRDTYLVRFPEYGVGTFIKLGGDVYRIEGIGKKIELISLNGEKKYIYRDEMKKAKIMDLKTRDAIVLHEDKEGVYIMDSKTYKTYFVDKKAKGKEKVRIVEYDGKIYVIE
ncbi:MAG: hypothetical protein J7K47_05560 [Thermoplasmata archaeon]|nr:hypothetical protein [Thermoplasmata archaeon]